MVGHDFIHKVGSLWISKNYIFIPIQMWNSIVKHLNNHGDGFVWICECMFGEH